MNNFTKSTAALLVLMNLAILITVIGFLLLAVGVVPGRHRYVTLNVTTRKSESGVTARFVKNRTLGRKLNEISDFQIRSF
jgi:hypothetical protein